MDVSGLILLACLSADSNGHERSPDMAEGLWTLDINNVIKSLLRGRDKYVHRSFNDTLPAIMQNSVA